MLLPPIKTVDDLLSRVQVADVYKFAGMCDWSEDSGKVYRDTKGYQPVVVVVHGAGDFPNLAGLPRHPILTRCSSAFIVTTRYQRTSMNGMFT